MRVGARRLTPMRLWTLCVWAAFGPRSTSLTPSPCPMVTHSGTRRTSSSRHTSRDRWHAGTREVIGSRLSRSAATPPGSRYLESITSRVPACHRSRDVWRDEDVRRVPEWVTIGQGLGVSDVERGPNAAHTQSVQKRIGVNRLAPTRIDKERARLHPGEERRVDELLSLGRQRQQVHHLIRKRQQLRKLRCRLHTVTCVPGNTDDVCAERREPSREGTANRSISDDKHGVAVDVVDLPVLARTSIPFREPLVFDELRKASLHRKDGSDHPLRDGNVMHADRPAYDDPGRHLGQQPVDACAERLHDTKPGQLVEEARQPVGYVEVDDDELDLRSRLGDELDAVR